MKRRALLAAVVTAAGATVLAAPPKNGPVKMPPRPAAVRPTPKPVPSRKPVHPGPMWSVAFSPDGTRLAVGGYRKVFVYDALTSAKTAEFVVSSDAVRSVAFSPDGSLLAAGTGVPGQSGAAVVLDAATGKVVRTIRGHADAVEAVAFSGGLLLSAANDERVCVTDVATGREVGKLAEHIGRCLSVAVPKEATPEGGGAVFATGGADNTVKIWDAGARRVVVNFDQCQSPVWGLASLGRGVFASGSGDGKLRLFRVRMDGGKGGGVGDGIPARAGSLQRQADAHEGGVYALAASGDGRFLVSGGADRKVVLWRGDGSRQKEFTDAGGDIWGVALSPDGKRAAAASLDGRVRLYDVEKGALLFTLDAKGPVALPLATQPGKDGGAE